MKKKHLLRALEDMVGNYDRAFNEGYAQALRDEQAASDTRVSLEYERGFKDGHDAGYSAGYHDGLVISTTSEQPTIVSAEDLRFSDDVIHEGAPIDIDEDELMKAFASLEGVPDANEAGC